MMTKIFGLAAALLMVLGAPLARAQTPVDYFNAGELVRFVNTFKYLMAYTPADLKTKLDNGRDLLTKAGATDKVIASYEALEQAYLPLPFQTEFASWTQPQKDIWNKTSMDYTAIGDWIGGPNTKPRFFYYFGYDAMYVGKTGPSTVGEWNYAISGVQTDYKSALKDFAWLRDGNPDIFPTLISPVRDAVNTIAKYYEKAIDPMGNGLSLADVTAMQQAAAPIFDGLSNGKLTQ